MLKVTQALNGYDGIYVNNKYIQDIKAYICKQLS